MNRPDHEPLSPEERALADRLARLGPHDGPSPALDARILAAAHAAVARPPRRRRWLGLAAVPGGLITGVGMAAALVVVVGVVWQLRPSGPAPRLPRGEGDMGYVSAEVVKREPREPVAPPPPAEAPARALDPPSEKRAAVLAQRETAASAPAVVADEAPAQAAMPAGVATVGPDEAPRHFDAIGGQAPAAQAYSAPAPAAPAAPPAPAVASAAAPAAVEAQAEAARQEAFGLTRARQQQRLDEAATAAARTQAAAKASAASDEGSATLDRIEVTGSRMKSADVAAVPLAEQPVGDDATLEAPAWIERIRARRDAGDLDGARESLKRFRDAHPRVRLPRDLREFAATR